MSHINRGLPQGLPPLPESPPQPNDGGNLNNVGPRRVPPIIPFGGQVVLNPVQINRPPIQQRVVKQAPPQNNVELRREAKHHSLPNRDQLISKAGKPKDDISFWIFGTKKMSTGYKSILSKLDEFHGQYGMDYKGTIAQEHQLDQLEDQLLPLKKAVDAYVSKGSHTGDTRNAEILKLQTQVNQEVEVLQDLMSQLEDGKSWPDDMNLKEVMDFAREGIGIDDMSKFTSHNIDAQTARAITEIGLSPSELGTYTSKGVSSQEAVLLYKNGFSPNDAKLYADHGIKVTPETLLARTQSDVSGVPQKLGNGAFNTVYLTKYKDGSEAVFKPLSPPDPTRTNKVETGWVAGRTGIDPYDPKIAMRNIASCEIAKELGFDVMPKTEIGTQKVPVKGLHQSQWPTQVGLVMERAPGIEARKAPSSLLNDPEVKRELTKLQLLDALLGQGDRHGGNYFIHKDPTTGKVRITGVDNDQCLGKNLTDPNGIARGPSNDPLTYGFRGVKLPEHVDQEMVDAFKNLTPERLAELLDGKVSPEEIEAAQDRLIGIKAHLRRLEVLTLAPGGEQRVISSENWNTVNFEYSDRKTSYYARDYYYAKQDEYQREQMRLMAQQNVLYNLNQI